MTYRYVLFDLDGTLTDSKPGIFYALKKAMKRRGTELPDNVLTKFLGPPITESLTAFGGFSEEEAELVKTDYRALYNAIGVYDNTLLAGIPRLLGALKDAGARLAVATSKPEAAALKVLDRFSLIGYFDFVSAANGEDGKKSEVVRRALETLGVGEEEKAFAVMVGDRKYDVLGAKENGIDAVGFTAAGYAEEGELEEAGATWITDDVNRLTRFLLNGER